MTTTPAPRSGEVWRAQAQRALVLADASARSRGATPAVWANLARASARLEGWRSPRTLEYVRQTLALRHPDGGWGIGEPSDVFGDGSVNPATTTYTVSTADHVGQMLLEGYDAGVVPREYLVGALSSLLRTQRVSTPRGTCVAYSSARADAVVGTARCVNNANIATAWFLDRVARRGVSVPGQAQLVADILRFDDAQYDAAKGLFRYGAYSTAGQDLDHNGLNVEAHWALGQQTPRSVGGRALAAMTARAPGRDALDPLGLLRVAPLDPGSCSRRTALADVMIRRVPGLTAHAAFDHAYLPAVRYSQVAVWSARNAVMCPSTLAPSTPTRPPGRR